MPAPRFYVEEPLSVAARVALPAAVGHHARTVLRLRDRDAIVLFNGLGGEYRAQLADAGGAAGAPLLADVTGFDPVEREAGLHLTLIQAQAAADKIDWVVEKAVEVGAARLIVTPAARSAVRLDAERAARRRQHWRELAIAACCQCGRNRVMEVAIAKSLAEALAHGGDADLRCVLDPAAARGLPAPPPGARRLCLAVGPEGGFEAGELQLAAQAGYVAVSLGPRVLRTETAALVAAAAWLALNGEFA